LRAVCLVRAMVMCVFWGCQKMKTCPQQPLQGLFVGMVH